MILEKRLKEIFIFIRNGKSIKQKDGQVGIPITRIETIWNQTIDTDRLGYADISNQDLGLYEQYLMKKGDILMSHINSPKHLGKSAMYVGVPKNLIHGMNLLCLRPNQDLIDPLFISYYFNSLYFRSQVTKISNQSVNQASFSAGNLKNLNILLPPLEEQKKLAAILDAADAYRQKTKALIDKYDQLTQSLFLDMFGDPVTNPMGWQRLQLKEFGKIITGNTPSKKHPEYYDQSFIEWIKTDNIVDGVKYITPSKSHLSQNGLKHGRLVKAGSVLIACIAGSLKSIGRAALTDRTVAFNQQINAVEPNNTVNSNFLYYLIRVNMEYIQSFASSSMKKMISKGVLKEIVFYLPPLELQIQFAERLAQIEKQKHQAEEALVKAEELFNSLLQNAFKGELTN